MKKISLLLGILLSVTSCTVLYRSVKYYKADITDHEIFPYTEVNPSDDVYSFQKSYDLNIDTFQISYKTDSAIALSQFLEESSTTSFLIIRNDSILFERYYNAYTPDQISTFFSVSKSVTSLLMGIAIDEGLIDDVHDPITKYIPELKEGDPMFEKLTIEHLLDMRSGMRYNEKYNTPFSHMAKIYYGTNHLGKIKRMKFDHEPGTVHDYQSSSTALLGIAIEKASGMELGKYLEDKIWKPLGMEHQATWSVDDKRHRSAKAYCGLNATAIDLAKIGRLYLNKGKWDGNQIVSEEWVEKSTTPRLENEGYQYQWWSMHGRGLNKAGGYYFSDSISAVNNMAERYENKYKYYEVWKDEKAPDPEKPWRIVIYTDSYYALGIMKQVLYIDPIKNIIMVRLGATGDKHYQSLMFKIAKKL